MYSRSAPRTAASSRPASAAAVRVGKCVAATSGQPCGDGQQVIGVAAEHRQIGNDDTQRGVHLMRQALDELSDGGQLLVLDQLSLDALETGRAAPRTGAGSPGSRSLQTTFLGGVARVSDRRGGLFGQRADEGDMLLGPRTSGEP